MYMASDSLFDEFISHFIENLGPGSAFSCILDVQFTKISPASPVNTSACAKARKSFLAGEGAEQTFGLLGAEIKYMVYGFPFKLYFLYCCNLLW